VRGGAGVAPGRSAPSVSRGPNLVGFVNTLRARLIASHSLSFGGATVCGVEICHHTLDIEWPAKLVVVVDLYKPNSLIFSLAPPQDSGMAIYD
jgi:hypothetical protein